MGAYLEKPVKDFEKRRENGAVSGGRLAFGSTAIQGWRTSMEDAHTCKLSYGQDPTTAFFGVFDGHGGIEVANYCKEHIPEELLTDANFIDAQRSSTAKADQYTDALRNTFLRVDQAVLDGWKDVTHKASPRSGRHNIITVEQEPLGAYEEGGPGSTAAVCLIKDRKLYIAWCGDSRIVLCRRVEKDGAQGCYADQLTEDHYPSLPSEKKRIEALGGSIKDGRVNGNMCLTRTFGNFAYKNRSDLSQDNQLVTARPDTKCVDLTADCEFLILGSDGLFDRMDAQDVVEFVRPKVDKGQRLDQVCVDLIEEVLPKAIADTDGLGCDNMTCIIIDLVNNNRKLGYRKMDVIEDEDVEDAHFMEEDPASGSTIQPLRFETLPESPHTAPPNWGFNPDEGNAAQANASGPAR